MRRSEPPGPTERVEGGASCRHRAYRARGQGSVRDVDAQGGRGDALAAGRDPLAVPAWPGGYVARGHGRAAVLPGRAGLRCAVVWRQVHLSERTGGELLPLAGGLEAPPGRDAEGLVVELEEQVAPVPDRGVRVTGEDAPGAGRLGQARHPQGEVDEPMAGPVL